MTIEFDGVRYEQTSTHQQEWGARLIAELDLSGRERILDVGCGDGSLTASLAGLVPRGGVLGIDASAGMVDAARRHRSPRLEFRQLDVTECDFVEDFDLVFSNAALHWVHDHDALMDILHRALRPDGLLRVNFAADGNCATYFRVVREYMREGEFREALAGFEWPWHMPLLQDYEELMQRSQFAEHRTWGENADRSFPDREALLGWIAQPSIVPFTQYLDPETGARFHAAVAARMVEETRQADGTYFETFRRVNVLARKGA